MMIGRKDLVHDRPCLRSAALALLGPQLLPVWIAALPALRRLPRTAEADDAEQLHQPPLLPVAVFRVPSRGADAGVWPRVVHQERSIEEGDVVGHHDRP